MENTWLAALGPDLAAWATFFAVVLAFWGIYLLSTYRSDKIRQRLVEIQGWSRPPASKPGQQQDGAFQVRWLEPMGEFIMPRDEWQRSILKRRLVVAGFRHSSAILLFLGSKLLCAGLAVMLVLAAYLLTGNFFLIASFQPILLMGLGALAGFLIPDLYIGQVTRRRQLDFTEGFPDALDLLVVCVEAGLGLDAAIDRVAREIRLSHAQLAGELALITMEIRAGRSRREALQGLSERTQVEQVQSLVTLLVQAEQFGTSVASALRGYAEEMRIERIQRAREKAAKLPVKLIFPVALFIFPALFLVVLGPAVIQIFAVLGDTL